MTKESDWPSPFTLQLRHNGRDGVSLASPLFTQPFIHTQINENIKAPRHWPLWGEFPAQMASNAENVSIWWRHHEPCERTSREHKPPCDYSCHGIVLRTTYAPGQHLIPWRRLCHIVVRFRWLKVEGIIWYFDGAIHHDAISKTGDVRSYFALSIDMVERIRFCPKCFSMVGRNLPCNRKLRVPCQNWELHFATHAKIYEDSTAEIQPTILMTSSD